MRWGCPRAPPEGWPRPHCPPPQGPWAGPWRSTVPAGLLPVPPRELPSAPLGLPLPFLFLFLDSFPVISCSAAQVLWVTRGSALAPCEGDPRPQPLTQAALGASPLSCGARGHREQAVCRCVCPLPSRGCCRWDGQSTRPGPWALGRERGRRVGPRQSLEVVSCWAEAAEHCSVTGSRKEGMRHAGAGDA